MAPKKRSQAQLAAAARGTATTKLKAAHVATGDHVAAAHAAAHTCDIRVTCGWLCRLVCLSVLGPAPRGRRVEISLAHHRHALSDASADGSFACTAELAERADRPLRLDATGGSWDLAVQ